MPEINITAWSPIKEARIHSCGVSVHAPGASFGPYRMDEYEFVWILEGEVRADYGGTAIRCVPGSVLLSIPGMTYSYKGASRRRTVHVYLSFSMRPNPPLGWPPPMRFPRARHPRHDSLYHALFRHLMSFEKQDSAKTAPAATSALNLMLRAFISGNDSLVPIPVATLPRQMERALSLITEHALVSPHGRLSLGMIANHVSVSRQHLCRMFRQYAGAGPLAYDRNLRLEQAALLLARTSFIIKEIADRTGFVSPFHFSRAFKALYGCAPQRYRSRYGAGDERIPNPLTRVFRKLLRETPA
jgi:AraC-like DNA-binding protein